MRDVNPVGVTLRSTWGVTLGVALVTGLCSMVLPSRAGAATIVVNSLYDTMSNNGVCTLREAILNAEGDNHSGSTDCAAGSGADTIAFTVNGTIRVPSALTITSPKGLTIDGGGKIIISGSDAQRSDRPGKITVDPAGVLTLAHLTVTESCGISNGGILTISDSRVDSNGAAIVNGNELFCFFEGGISNSGTMTISHSTISGNGVDKHMGSEFIPPFGGGIDNSGTMAISHSTISGNGITGGPRFDATGGAIHNAIGNTLTLSYSTVSDNGSLPPSFPAVTSGIFNNGTLKLSTSLLADGCSGPITSLGYNLDKIGTCGLTATGDKSNIDPRLDPAGLKDNGGPTKTLALCTGSGTPAGCTGKSPAIDAIPTANCTGAGGNPLGVDQRGFFRPADGDRNGTVLCDMGAFEATSSPLQTLNSLVTFTPLPATYQTSRDTTGCPAGSVGKFRFTADLTNKPGSPPLSHLVAEVATLTKGNLVLNADGGLGGDGATITFSPNGQYADGVLSAKEHVGLPVTLCLKTFDQFTFFVDVLGTH